MIPSRRSALILASALAFHLLPALAQDAQPPQEAAARAAWLKVKSQLDQAGVSLDLARFNLPAIPDEQNFAAHPIVAELLATGSPDDAQTTRLGKIDLGKLPGFPAAPLYQRFRWREATPLDLAAISGDADDDRDAAAKKLLRGLGTWDAELAELAAAAKRPGCRYPLDWADAILPTGSAPLFRAQRVLELRALSHLQLAGHHQATADTLTLLQLHHHHAALPARRVAANPSLLGVLLSNASASLALQCLWEGLRAHQWDPLGLLLFESKLGEIDVPAQFATGIEFELAFGAKAGLQVLSGEKQFADLYDPSVFGTVDEPTRAEIYQDLADTTRTTLRILLSPTAGKQPVLDPARLRALDELVGDVPPSAPVWSSHRTLGIFRMVGINCLHLQADLANARIAIALERHRLKHGKWPARLDDLVPTYLDRLPADPMTGRPPIFKLRPDGSPAIYSVGWDGDDDGGVPTDPEQAESAGDWAWQYSLPSATE